MRSRGQHMSRRQERSVANDIGGRVQVASGATDFAKGDVRAMGELRIECKTTSSGSYSLKKNDITKITTEALSGGLEDWAMQIEFQGQMGIHKKVAVIDWNTFLDLREKAQAAGKYAGPKKCPDCGAFHNG